MILANQKMNNKKFKRLITYCQREKIKYNILNEPEMSFFSIFFKSKVVNEIWDLELTIFYNINENSYYVELRDNATASEIFFEGNYKSKTELFNVFKTLNKKYRIKLKKENLEEYVLNEKK